MFTSRRRIDRPEAQWLSVCLIALACCLSTRTLAAQEPAAERAAGQFKEIRDYPEVERGQQRRLDLMAESGTISDRQLLESVYDDRLSRFTWRTYAGNLHQIRDQLKRRWLSRATGQAHAELNAYVLQWMQRIANDDEFDPKSRFNATLVIGDLNDVEPNFAGAGAVPMTDALPVLIELVGADDFLTIGAVQKIRRHAEAGITNSNQRTQVARAMLELVAAEDRYPWARWRSAQVLGAVGMAGIDRNSSDIVDALVGLMMDEKVGRSGRCAAAGSLAGIDFSAAPPTLDYSKITRAVAKLALEVGKQEMDEEAAEKSVRRLLGRLDALDNALSGRTVQQRGIRRPGAEPVREGGLVKAAADTPHADYVGAVAQNVQAMLEPLLDLDTESQSDEVPGAFAAPLEAHEEWVEQNPPPE